MPVPNIWHQDQPLLRAYNYPLSLKAIKLLGLVVDILCFFPFEKPKLLLGYTVEWHVMKSNTYLAKKLKTKKLFGVKQ